MFKITDEFLEKAGLGALLGAHKEDARQEITDSVRERVMEAVAMRISEEEAGELEQVMDGDMEAIRNIASRIDGDYRQLPEFIAMQDLGRRAGASDDDILVEYIKLAWFKKHNIDIAAVIKNAMESVLISLQNIHARVSE
ncbi:MAG: hypothetical protein Q4B05_03040 [Candidatus Saccharibacteria bacterium]|nr:hypothetical protein [Candidatus Saccharibacteria bacterium]